MKPLFNDYQIDIISNTKKISIKSRAVQLLYVVDGYCVVEISTEKIKMTKSDVLAINTGESLQLKIQEDALAAVVSIEYYVLCDLLKMDRVLFYVNSLEDTGQKYTELKTQMQKFLLAYVSNTNTSRLLERGYYYLLLETLTSKFLIKNVSYESDKTYDPHVLKMLHYAHSNYRTNASLNEIASQLYISPSWASRIFQKATGEYFPAYIRNIRLKYAKRELEESVHPITQIAIDNGFSTPSAFNRSFKTEFGITPSEYRDKYGQKPEKVVAEEQSHKKLLQVLLEDQKLAISDLEKQTIINVDTTQRRNWKKWENKILNVGPAYFLSSANLQKQILFLTDRLEIEYLRIWNIFSSKMMIQGKETKNYNFTFIDEIMDFCVDNKLKLFIDLAQRKDLAMASENERIYSYEDDTIFENDDMWINILQNFLLHICKRYSEKTIRSWIFELTFFLNDKPYYISKKYSSRMVWDQGYSLIKTIIPSARVAGPGLIATDSHEYMEMVIKHMLSAQNVPDIFTSMHFPYVSDFLDVEGSIYQGEYKKVASRNFMQEQAEVIQKILNENHFSGEYWITDWGNSLANRNYVQDSCFRATFIIENILNVQKQVGAMGIFYASDIINTFSDSSTILSGSAGLLSRDGICKPAYYAYYFMGCLGKYLIVQTESCIVTAESAEDIRILCYNNKALGPRYYLAEENTYRPEELENLFINLDPLNMEIVLQFLNSEETYIIRQNILNTQKGSILNKWIAFGCSRNLSRSDLEYLEKISMPEITAEHTIPLNGTIPISIKMEPNEIRLITISKE